MSTGKAESEATQGIPRQRTPQNERLLPAGEELLLRKAAPEGAHRDATPSTRDVDHDLTVIVPTRNESGNIEPLLDRLGKALGEFRACVMFVDDSDDDTPDQVLRASQESPLTVRLHHRRPDERGGGLGGAVLAGLRETRSVWAVVMDGDLQHPPELVPALVTAGCREGADVVVASRHVRGGSAEGLSGGVRRFVSDASTVLSKAFFPYRLKGVSDPMSGFFALRTDAFDLDTMRPAGFKILLEMLARTPGLTKWEIPFVFGERHAGDSKASVREGVRFIRQLVRLSASRLVPKPAGRAALRRGAGFAAVGATGLVINLLATWLLVEAVAVEVGYVLAAALATQLSSTWNFVLTDRLVYRGSKRYTGIVRWLGFMGASNAVLLLRIPMLALLVEVLGLHYIFATALTLMLGFLVRFKSQERLTLTEAAA